MTHPTLEDAARAAYAANCAMDPLDAEREPDWGREGYKVEAAVWQVVARAVLLSIRPPDREDLPLRQLEARDYIDGILKERTDVRND